MEIAGGAAPGIIMGVVEYSSELAIKARERPARVVTIEKPVVLIQCCCVSR